LLTDLKVIRPLIFALLTLTAQAKAECQRTEYTFKKPDAHILFQRTAKEASRGVVILSHGGTSGGTSRGLLAQWGGLLKKNGFNVVLMSHYSARGLTDTTCKANYTEAEAWRRQDTLNVLKWLAKRHPEDAKRVVLMGFSAGAAAVFPFVTDSPFNGDIPEGVEVRSGVLFYPWQRSCISPERSVNRPVLFVGAELDGTFRCWSQTRWLTTAQTNSLFTLKVYKGANHAFDFEKLSGKRCEGGPYPYCMEYHEASRLAAEQDVLRHLTSIGL
jgi:dienelactone hydrolase